MGKGKPSGIRAARKLRTDATRHAPRLPLLRAEPGRPVGHPVTRYVTRYGHVTPRTHRQ